MRYLGGKSRQARHIAQVLRHLRSQSNGNYYEPFIGGASVFDIAAPMFEQVEASDIHLDLMMMWQSTAGGWWVPPSVVSAETYVELRDAEPSALRGFVGFGCSYGGKWFGGYARERVDYKHTGDICGASRSSVLKSSLIMRNSNARLLRRSYADLDPKPGSMIYCDPPYAGTTGYSDTESFDHSLFWDTARSWALVGCLVLVSEYSAPENIPVVWERSARKSVGDNVSSSSTERVFGIFPPGVDTRYRSLLQ